MCNADIELVRRIELGDPSAEIEFATIWYPRIYGWVRQQVRGDEARDYAQDVWMHLAERRYHRLLKWRGLWNPATVNPHSFAAYLKKVTALKVIDLLRASGRLPPLADDHIELTDDTGPLGGDPFHVAVSEEQMEILEHVISEFSDRDQQLMDMKSLGHSQREIGEILDMTANNVGVRHHYLIRKLLPILRERMSEDFGNV